MMMMKKIRGHESAAARFIVDENNNLRGLRSYSTTVITIDENGWMTVHGLYSRTTIKHIGWLMRELGLSYYTAKDCYLNDIEMNLHTGEIRNRV